MSRFAQENGDWMGKLNDKLRIGKTSWDLRVQNSTIEFGPNMPNTIPKRGFLTYPMQQA